MSTWVRSRWTRGSISSAVRVRWTATETINLSGDAHGWLKPLEPEDESVSDVIRRITGTERDVWRGLGLYADETGARLRDAVLEGRAEASRDPPERGARVASPLDDPDGSDWMRRADASAERRVRIAVCVSDTRRPTGSKPGRPADHTRAPGPEPTMYRAASRAPDPWITGGLSTGTPRSPPERALSESCSLERLLVPTRGTLDDRRAVRATHPGATDGEITRAFRTAGGYCHCFAVTAKTYLIIVLIQ